MYRKYRSFIKCTDLLNVLNQCAHDGTEQVLNNNNNKKSNIKRKKKT